MEGFGGLWGPLPVYTCLWHVDGSERPPHDHEYETQQTTVCKNVEEVGGGNEQVYVRRGRYDMCSYIGQG